MFKRKQRASEEVESPEQLLYENAKRARRAYCLKVETFYPSEYEKFLKSIWERPVGEVIALPDFPPLVLPNGEILLTYGVLK